MDKVEEGRRRKTTTTTLLVDENVILLERETRSLCKELAGFMKRGVTHYITNCAHLIVIFFRAVPTSSPQSLCSIDTQDALCLHVSTGA